MYCKLTALLLAGFISVVLAGPLYSADEYRDGSVSVPELVPIEDDPTIYNDCNYCHGLHNARRDVSAVLNNSGERYERYIGGSFLSEGDERSVFADEVSRKCPRSRVKNRW